MAQYEIEIKSLLGSREAADNLKAKLVGLDPACQCVNTNKQLNHYFEGGSVETLYQKVETLFTDSQLSKLKQIVNTGTSFSVRTRQKDNEVLLVVKAAVDGGTSTNGVSRLEFEEAVALSLEELDQLVLAAGYQYQAKWSREREEYSYKGANVCIDKNAGYGYLAEFEKVVEDEASLVDTRHELEALMVELGVVELLQERLARMFDHYNQNWADYYGTDKVFTIE